MIHSDEVSPVPDEACVVLSAEMTGWSSEVVTGGRLALARVLVTCW